MRDETNGQVTDPSRPFPKLAASSRVTQKSRLPRLVDLQGERYLSVPQLLLDPGIIVGIVLERHL